MPEIVVSNRTRRLFQHLADAGERILPETAALISISTFQKRGMPTLSDPVILRATAVIVPVS